MNELFRTLLGLPEQASTVATQIDYLHYVVITTALLGATGVAAAIIFCLYRFRGDAATENHRGPSAPFWLELMAVGGLLGMFLAFWLVGFRQYMTLQTPPADAIDIYVIGKQWMWSFAYPDGTVSNVELRVPAGRPVRLLMTSRDVIHSFYVPAFRVKQDVVPGRMTSLWFEARRPGTYDILCAEYCGLSHSRMRGRVVVVPPSQLGDREGEQSGDLAATGQRVAAERGCLRCHTVDGTPHIGPTFAGLWGSRVPLISGGSVVADGAYLTESMMDPLAKLHAGFPPVMPSYFGRLSAVETAALVELIRSLRDRGGGDEPLAPAPTGSLATPTTEVPR